MVNYMEINVSCNANYHESGTNGNTLLTGNKTTVTTKENKTTKGIATNHLLSFYNIFYHSKTNSKNKCHQEKPMQCETITNVDF